MTKKIQHNNHPALLAEKLRAVIDCAKSAAGPVDNEPLAILHLVDGLSYDEWMKIASAHDLHDWVAFPITKDNAQIVQEVLEVQKQLLFQRDHDYLTNLPNRRTFFDRLAIELTRAKRTSSDASLAVIDLDDFKRVNDTYGHLCGDVVLKELAKLLSTETRMYDTASRVGGEEFAVLLPSTSITTAKSIIDGLRERFSHHIFTCKNVKFTCTFSSGISSVKALGGNPTPEELFEEADQAMYLAKHKGKNLVCTKKTCYLEQDRLSLVRSHEKQFLFSGIITDNKHE